MTSGSALTLSTSDRPDAVTSATTSEYETEAPLAIAIGHAANTLSMQDFNQWWTPGGTATLAPDIAFRLAYASITGIEFATAFSGASALGTATAQFYDPLASPFIASAFSTLDDNLSRDATAEADRALQHLSGDLGKLVSSRLHQLVRLALEDGSAASFPSAQSFRALVDFLVQNRTLRKPALTLDDEGLVWAEWRKSSDCLVALRFMADGTIRWIIISPARLRRSGRVVWRGDGGADDVRSAIDARPAVHWIIRQAGAAV